MYIIMLICREEVESLREDTASDILSGKVDQIAKWVEGHISVKLNYYNSSPCQNLNKYCNVPLLQYEKPLRKVPVVKFNSHIDVGK